MTDLFEETLADEDIITTTYAGSTPAPRLSVDGDGTDGTDGDGTDGDGTDGTDGDGTDGTDGDGTDGADGDGTDGQS